MLREVKIMQSEIAQTIFERVKVLPLDKQSVVELNQLKQVSLHRNEMLNGEVIRLDGAIRMQPK